MGIAKQPRVLVPILAAVSLFAAGLLAVPLTFNYQGHVAVSGVPFEGNGQFRFAILDGTGQSVWSQDGSSVAGSEPTGAVELPVRRGVFSLDLGDSTIPGMAVLSTDIFDSDTLFLRVWFNDGVNGFLQLGPDRRIGSVAFSIRAASAATVTSIPEGILETRHLPSAFTDRVAALEAALTVLADQVNSAPSGSLAASLRDQDSDLLARGYQSFHHVEGGSWSAGTSTGEPAARSGHAGVWAGDHLIVWGGSTGGGTHSDQGFSYDPAADNWTRLSPIGAPSARSGAGAAWSGTDLFLWGGIDSAGWLGDGARFRPETGTWFPMSLLNAPSSRDGHVAVWTGARLIVWGGKNGGGLLNDGALYDPATDAWTEIGVPGAPGAPAPRYGAAAVWAGDRLIVWGGDAGSPLDTGAQLVFTGGVASAWNTISPTASPSARAGHSAVWTGERMLVWGGESGSGPLGDGAGYDPDTDAWTPLATADAPAARSGHRAVWTGTEMMILGGAGGSGEFVSGHAYDPATDSWRALPPADSPVARRDAVAVWTGSEVLVYGGKQGASVVAAIRRLDPQPPIHLYHKP